MNEHPYLIFKLNDSLYGIDSYGVEEVFFLPELKTIPDTPDDIIGLVDVRGYIIPVMDLNIRFGYQPQKYKLTDTIVVIKSKDIRMGLIINGVQEVSNLKVDKITFEVYLRRELSDGREKFIDGIAKKNEDIIFILNSEKLLGYVERKISDNQDGKATKTEDSQALLEQKLFLFSHATDKEKHIFRQRAKTLSSLTAKKDFTGFKSLAVIILNDEYYGIDLTLIREFTDFELSTPIPCTPSHIIGNMNLRGEIITLIDLRSILNLPMDDISSDSQVMIVEIQDILVGIYIKEVFDIIFVNPQEILSPPSVNYIDDEQYLEGTTKFQGKTMSILDLKSIFLGDKLVVNETI